MSLLLIINILVPLLLIGVECRYESGVHFRIEAGERTCFYENGEVGQMLEAQYQVVDGQHGDFDVSFDIVGPNGTKIVSDYKRSQNSIIMDLEEEGEYSFCMDNTHSLLYSKLVFVYVLVEEKDQDYITIVSEDNEEVLEWMGTDETGQEYYLEVANIANSLTKTLSHVVKARHHLDMYRALRSKDSYQAFKDTFIVDAWSFFQISVMCVVGLVQVYMIKSLFSRSIDGMQCFY